MLLKREKMINNILKCAHRGPLDRCRLNHHFNFLEKNSIAVMAVVIAPSVQLFAESRLILP